MPVKALAMAKEHVIKGSRQNRMDDEGFTFARHQYIPGVEGGG
jgi:hypothetical protein